MAYESQICSLNKDKKNIESLIIACQKTGNLPQILGFYKLKVKITENIANLTSAKNNLVNVATADTIIAMEQKQDLTKINNEVENVI